jgi:hypothetical protein
VVPPGFLVEIFASNRRHDVTQRRVIQTTVSEPTCPIERSVLLSAEAEHLSNLNQRVHGDETERGFAVVMLCARCYGFQSFTSFVL